MEERKYSVYMHTNKINNKKYIGITSLNPTQRWKKDGSGYKNQIFGRAISKYGWDNFNHDIIAENLTLVEAEEMERKLIKQYNTQNYNFGYNIADGGGATLPSLCNKVYWYDLCGNLLGIFDSQGIAEKETGIRRDVIGKVCAGKSYTANNYFFSHTPMTVKEIEEKLKLREQIIQNNQTEGIKKAITKISIKVQQIDPITNEVIAEYNSQREAARAVNVDQKGISKAIAGIYKTSGVYKWKKIE